MVDGPGCTGIANTVHHVEASSVAPHLFWEPRNLVASCARCNYSGGARLAAGNRRAATERIAELRQENERLERVVQTLEERIDSLAEALAAARNGATQKPSGKPAQPAIY